MVLSEVAKAPHDDVRIGRLNVWGGVRTSRHQPIHRGRHDCRPSGTSPARRTPGRELARNDQAGFAWPQSNDVPSTQMQWRITAISRAMATFAFFIPIRFASFVPQTLREDHFFVR